MRDTAETPQALASPSLLPRTCGVIRTIKQLNVEKGLIGAAVLGALVLMAPMAKQSKEFVNCVKNAETGIVNLTGVELLDEDGKGGFIERPVAVHWCNGGDISQYLQMVGQ